MTKINPLLAVLNLLLVLAVPPFLLLTNLYPLMSSAFLRYEYGKADFPPAWGFTAEERLRVAEKAVHYLRSDADISLLRDLKGEQGPLFNERELAHMVDVKVLTQRAFSAHAFLGVLIGASVTILLARRETKRGVPSGLLAGSLLTIALLILLIAVAYFNFDWFFVRFHRLFFEGDTWIFAYSDTLIRLFPPRFWFDATQALCILTLTEAALLGAVSYWWGRRI